MIKYNKKTSKPKNIWHTIINVVLAGTLLGMGMHVTGIAAQNIAGKKSKHYVEKRLEEVMKTQEETLGIEHVGMPNISYKCSPGFFGEYIPERDELCLLVSSAVTPEKNLLNALAGLLGLKKVHAIKKTLDHELGHFYMDKLNESRDKGNWPSQEYFSESDDNWVGTRLIAEGVAVYFERSLNPWEDPFEDINKMTQREALRWANVYEIGFRTVKPIIENYGKKAIEYMMDNPPPLGSNLKDLPTKLNLLKLYQTMVIYILSENAEKE